MGGFGRLFCFAILWNIDETHRMKKFAILPACAFAALVIQAQTIAKPATNENFRGLSAPSEKVVWASGTHGTYVKTVDGKFQLIKTDNGKDWSAIPAANMPAAIEGEGAFAASGTCLVTQGKKNVWFATGGAAARVFHSADRGRSWMVSETPIMHAKP